MPAVLSVLQALGALAVLAGVALVLPLGWAVLVDGLLVLVLSTAFEVALTRARRAAPDRRSAPTDAGVA